MNLTTLLDDLKQNRESWRLAPLDGLLPVHLDPAQEGGRVDLEGYPITDGFSRRLVFVDGFLRSDASTPDLVEINIDDYTLLIKGDAEPLELLFIQSSNKKPTESSVKLSVFLEKKASITLLEQHIFLDGAASVALMDLHVHLQEGATLHHGKLINAPDHGAALAQEKIHLAKNTTYDHSALIIGTGVVRQAPHLDLDDEGCFVDLRGLMLLDGKAHADLNVLVNHLKPRGMSDQKIKAVLRGKAHGVFQGKIAVFPDAQKTIAQQSSRGLLLSPLADMKTKPELEIYADDVVCSHGSAIGALDEESLFYLLSRGIPPLDAEALLVRAFTQDLLDSMSDDLLRNVFHKNMLEFFA